MVILTCKSWHKSRDVLRIGYGGCYKSIFFVNTSSFKGNNHFKLGKWSAKHLSGWLTDSDFLLSLVPYKRQGRELQLLFPVSPLGLDQSCRPSALQTFSPGGCGTARVSSRSWALGLSVCGFQQQHSAGAAPGMLSWGDWELLLGSGKRNVSRSRR